MRRVLAVAIVAAQVAAAALILVASGCARDGQRAPEGPPVTATPIPGDAARPHGDVDHHGVHGMVVFGQRQVFVSHLPLYHAPHDYQVVARVDLDPITRQRWDADRQATGQAFYTLVPERFDLRALDPARPAHRFRGELVRGHFERGGTALPGEGRISVARILAFRPLVATTPRPASARYLLLGEAAEPYLIHEIAGAPDFDQIARLAPLGGDAPAAAALAAGVAVTLRDQPVTTPVAPGQAVVADLDGGGQVALVVADVLYLEHGDLAE